MSNTEDKQAEERYAQKLNWIAEHGSERLKKAIAQGYPAEYAYAEERSAKEFPGSVIDLDNNAEWGALDCPSEADLDLISQLREQGHKAKAVWLTDDGLDREDLIFEPRDAVVIQYYLERYHLILPEGGLS